MRSIKHALLLAIVGFCLCGQVRAAQVSVDCDPHAPGARLYNVLRGTEQVGTLSVAEHTEGDISSFCTETVVGIRALKVLPIYRFKSVVKEDWKDGRLDGLSALTWENGTLHELVGRSDGPRFKALYDLQTFEAPSTIGTTQFFNRFNDSFPVLLDPATGRTSIAPRRVDLGDASAVVNGQVQELRHYSLAGDVRRDIWLKGDTLVCLRYAAADGTEMSYELVN